MLIRIVRLTLHPEKIEAFKSLFSRVAPEIRAFDGCGHLELWSDAMYPNIVATYSHWAHEEALNRYRNSEFFRATWGQTRSLFAAPPVAQSYSTESDATSPIV
jgi:quinol monooxygenase YgiN